MPPKRKRGGWDDPDTILTLELIMLKEQLSKVAAEGGRAAFQGPHYPPRPGFHGMQRPTTVNPAESEVLSIVVGEEARWFTWHEVLLKTHSPYLFARLQGESINKARVGGAPVLVLPDAEVMHFDILNDWLYPLKPPTPKTLDQYSYIIKNYEAAWRY